MQQSEYVVRDINNSVKFLTDGGKILIDDIIHLTYDEQLKIPKKHYYDNGILKYGEPWTGDIWKVIYYILLFHAQDLDFSYYYHLNYRGVAMLHINHEFQIDESELTSINGYDYFKDFKNYMNLLENFTEHKRMSFTRISIEETNDEKSESESDEE